MFASSSFGLPPGAFFEWDGHNLNAVPGTPNTPFDGSFVGNMLVLPTGQIRFTDFSNDVEIFTPTPGHPKSAEPTLLFTPIFLAGLLVGGDVEVSGYETIRRDGHRAVIMRPGILHMPVDDIRDAYQRVIGCGLNIVAIGRALRHAVELEAEGLIRLAALHLQARGCGQRYRVESGVHVCSVAESAA